jgi:hypothetical protein
MDTGADQSNLEREDGPLLADVYHMRSLLQATLWERFEACHRRSTIRTAPSEAAAEKAAPDDDPL